MTAAFRSTLDPGRPFAFFDGDFTGSNAIWTGHLPALNVGPYEAKVNVTLRTGPNPDGSFEPPIDEVISSGVMRFRDSKVVPVMLICSEADARHSIALVLTGHNLCEFDFHRISSEIVEPIVVVH